MLICTIYRNKKLIGKINTADYSDLDTINVGGDSVNTVVLESDPMLPDHLFSLTLLDGTFWLVATGDLPLSMDGKTLSEGQLKVGRIFQLGLELELVVSGVENPSDYALLYRVDKKFGWMSLDHGSNLLERFSDGNTPNDSGERPRFCCRCEINPGRITIESLDTHHPVKYRGAELTEVRRINAEELFFLDKKIPAMVVPHRNIEQRLQNHDPFYPKKLQWVAVVLLALLALLTSVWFYNQIAEPEASGRAVTFAPATPHFPKDPAMQAQFMEELEESWLPNLQRDIYGKALADIRHLQENQELPADALRHFELREKEILQVRSAIRLVKYAESRSHIYSVANIAKHYAMPIAGPEWIAISESDQFYWQAMLEKLQKTQILLAEINCPNARRVNEILQKCTAKVEKMVQFSQLNHAMYTAYNRHEFLKTAEILQANAQFEAEMKLFAGFPDFYRALELNCAFTTLHQETISGELTPAQAVELLPKYAELEKKLTEIPVNASNLRLASLQSQLAVDRNVLQQLIRFRALWSDYESRHTLSDLLAAWAEALQIDNTRNLIRNRFFQTAFKELEKDYFDQLNDAAKPLPERYDMIQSMKVPLNLNPIYGRRAATLESAMRHESQKQCLLLYNRYQEDPDNRPALLQQIKILALPGSSFYDWAERQQTATAKK